MRHVQPLPFQPANISEANAFELVVFEEAGAHVIEGLLRHASSGAWLPIMRGVPCFLTGPLRLDLRDFCDRYGLESPQNAR